MLEFEVHYDAVDKSDMHLHNLMRPVPAISMLPEWFKRLKTNDDPDQEAATVKQCRGVWDILSMGYLILWPFDVEIFKNPEGKLDIVKARSKTTEDFHPHPHVQLEGYQDINLQNQAQGIQKISTPYKIKTPPGTSIMMMQPPYRPDLKTTVMPGVIDTDTYYGEFNVLFTINEVSGKRKLKIRGGTPLAQIVPFVREEWNLKFGKIDKEEEEVGLMFAQNVDKFYQKHMWHRKVYKSETDSELANRD